MSSMFCNNIYRCKNAEWCARDFNPKSEESKCFEPMTKADVFRSLNDEELANYLCDRACFLCVIQECEGRMEVGRDECKRKWLEYLKTEVE